MIFAGEIRIFQKKKNQKKKITTKKIPVRTNSLVRWPGTR
jgi:hypothetical protein